MQVMLVTTWVLRTSTIGGGDRWRVAAHALAWQSGCCHRNHRGGQWLCGLRVVYSLILWQKEEERTNVIKGRRERLQSKLVGKKWIIWHVEPPNSRKLSFTTPAGRLVAIVIHTVSKATGSATAGGGAVLFFSRMMTDEVEMHSCASFCG